MPEPIDTLTDRELEVAHLVVCGKRNSDIAAALHLSEDTVKFHLKNISDKLGVHNRTQIAVAAVQAGILPVDV